MNSMTKIYKLFAFGYTDSVVVVVVVVHLTTDIHFYALCHATHSFHIGPDECMILKTTEKKPHVHFFRADIKIIVNQNERKNVYRYRHSKPREKEKKIVIPRTKRVRGNAKSISQTHTHISLKSGKVKRESMSERQREGIMQRTP